MTNNSATNVDPLKSFLETMWNDYCKMNPQARDIFNAFTEQKKETVINDHIALRTFNHPKLGIKSLAKHFVKYGYADRGEYFFKEKKLYAKHYENTHNPDFPKIFISELELEKMSAFVQKTLTEAINQIPEQKSATENFIYSGRHWKADYKTYLKLAEESEYASWVYAFGFRPNHFTVSINHLKSFKNITEINDFVKSFGHKLNTSGGEIKGTATELLEQSSTLANAIPVEFSDGMHPIPACYYEFAKRYPDQSGKLYQGFIAKSADKIFESTNRS